MKKWTVMVIPHDRGNTRSLSVYSFHLWFVAAILAGLSFSTTFFYARQVTAAKQAEKLRQTNHDLEQAKESTPKPTDLSDQERADIERQVRTEYEARDAAITSELGELYDVEAQLRQIHGFPSKLSAHIGEGTVVKRSVDIDPSGGKGGPPGELAQDYITRTGAALRPPQIIYGMSRPSADLIIQEINLRTRSLSDLLASMLAERERIARMPALWPSISAARRISSTFGFRKDPFTNEIRHHDGTDISAPYGSNVVATGKGKVVFAGWDGDLGNLVRIDHGDGIETGYGHMSALNVSAGQTVDRGQVVGKVGSTGRSTGAHIHYEVHVNGKLVDPEPYLGN